MSEITLGTIRRRRYIDRTIIELPRADDDKIVNPPLGYGGIRAEWQSLYEKMLQNQVLMEFKTSEVNVQKGSYQDIKPMIMEIHEYCDKHCTGFWTYTRTYSRAFDYNQVSLTRQDKDHGAGRFIVHFEKEEDLEPFLKNCALVMKLSH